VSRYLDRDGRGHVSPADLTRKQARQLLRQGARGRREPRTPPTPADERSNEDRARDTARKAWRPASVDEYLDADWFVYERGDVTDDHAGSEQ
jgi:hypothetical protein